LVTISREVYNRAGLCSAEKVAYILPGAESLIKEIYGLLPHGLASLAASWAGIHILFSVPMILFG
jgi:hypothetical protein